MSEKSDVWITDLSPKLTPEQIEKLESEAFIQVFNACLQDKSYMKSIVYDYLANRTRLERVCEIAGGELEMTTEILGFDVTTGKEVEEEGE